MKLFVNNLTNVDFSYLHPQRGLLGESWLVQLELDGSLNDQGMVCDFGIVKKAVKDWFDQVVDHALVVPKSLADVAITTEHGYTEVSWSYPDGRDFYCNSPQQAICLVEGSEITEASLASWCHDQLLALFPNGVQGLSLNFIPEQIEGAFYHYSHGLQKHDGNCQRIAHGHRSKIEIFIDGQRNAVEEAFWADSFKDIYIGTRSHLVDQSDDYQQYRYTAPQGEFTLKLPSSVCYLIDTDSTVELIADHLAKQVKARYPNNDVLVRAYEGVGKGAAVAL